jgi:predicted dehydrogenase
MTETLALKAAIFGVGFIGAVHLESLRRLGVDVVAVAESMLASAKRYAKTYHVPKAYGDYRRLLEREEVDVVHICTPPALHYPMVKAALESGRHVICEKPLTVDSQQSQELVALAEEKKLIAAVNFNIRYYSVVQQAKVIVTAGELGSINVIHGTYLQDFHVPETPWGWRFEPQLAGNMLAVTEIGSHWLDLVRYITGLEVTSVIADFRTFYPWRKRPAPGGRKKIISENYASILLNYNSGAAGALTVSEISSGRKNQLRVEIVGTKASLAWDSERLNELWIGRKDHRNEVMVSGFSDGFADTFERLHREVYEFIQAGQNKKPIKPPFPTFADGHEIVQLCDAIEHSERERRWVEVEREG